MTFIIILYPWATFVYVPFAVLFCPNLLLVSSFSFPWSLLLICCSYIPASSLSMFLHGCNGVAMLLDLWFVLVIIWRHRIADEETASTFFTQSLRVLGQSVCTMRKSSFRDLLKYSETSPKLHYSSAYAPRRGWHIVAWINTNKPHAIAIVCRWFLLWRINSSRKLSQSYTASTCICKLSVCHLVVWAITNTFVYTSLIHILFDYLNIANT